MICKLAHIEQPYSGEYEGKLEFRYLVMDKV